jgi:L-threonylcarbamoyladenylate synthase
MKTEIMIADHPIAFLHAIDILRHGGVLAFPTDTVYGLAAYPFEESMVERLFTAKGRNSTKAIAILIGDMADLNRIVKEMVLFGQDHLPQNLSANKTIGVRMPNHPIALSLLKQAGPLAVTSANISGQENATSAQEVLEQLGGKIHLILDGGVTPGGIPSTVVDCTGPEPVILRKGPVSLKEIRAVL